MRVDLHVHSSMSDGRDGLRSLADAAEAKGLAAVAITDHGPGHGSGATERQVRRLKREAGLLQPDYRVRILVGIEAEILPTGEVMLDSRDGMDIVLASFHGRPAEEAYYRAVFKAVADPRVDVLAHHAWISGRTSATARYDAGLAGILASSGVAVEVNAGHALPSWDFLQLCRARGVRHTIGSDAHRAADVGSVAWARNTARLVFGGEKPFVPPGLREGRKS